MKKVPHLSEYRNNGWAWIGITVPWLAGILVSFKISGTLPEVGDLRATAVFLGLFAGAPAMCFTRGDRWGLVAAILIAATLFAAAIGFVTGPGNIGKPVAERTALVAIANMTMLATSWSVVFGWIALRVGDRRYLEIFSPGRARRPA